VNTLTKWWVAEYSKEEVEMWVAGSTYESSPSRIATGCQLSLEMLNFAEFDKWRTLDILKVKTVAELFQYSI